ncbi:MAG: thiamine phosphate synthase [Chloroflexi bacterium]|nr:thiamine phosphate synthase [Chloroflexota bacterium]
MRLNIPTLCLVTDRQRCNGRRIEDVVDSAIDGGVGLVQLREKDLPAVELYSLALRLKDVVGNRALLFVNDRVDVSLAAGADGAQLGETALPLQAARQIAGGKLLLGRSVHSVDGAVEAQSQGADLLTLGTIFPTASHPGGVTGGIALVREVAAAVDLPFLGIGGIDAENVGDVIACGASGAAVITTITTAPDPSAAASSLRDAMRSAFSPCALRAMRLRFTPGNFKQDGNDHD